MLQITFRKDENTVFLFLVAIFLAISLIAAIGLGVLSAKKQPSPLPPSDSAEEPEESTKGPDNLPVSSVVLGPSADLGEEYLKQIIFVGDSTTAHLRSRGVLPDGTETKQVWCPSNNTLLLSSSITSLKIVDPDTGEELTIAEAAKRKKPAYMVLTIGLNGSNTFTENVYKGCYRKLLDAVKAASPDTKLILQSVFPVATNESAWTALTPKELNLCIDKINSWQKELAEEYNIRYLDTQSILRDSNGYLKQEYQNGDGIHLTAEGYRALLSYIRTHGWLE